MSSQGILNGWLFFFFHVQKQRYLILGPLLSSTYYKFYTNSTLRDANAILPYITHTNNLVWRGHRLIPCKTLSSRPGPSGLDGTSVNLHIVHAGKNQKAHSTQSLRKEKSLIESLSFSQCS